MGWLEKFKPHAGAVYRRGGAGYSMPEPAYETATGRRLFTVQQMQAAYEAGTKDERERCAKVCENMRGFTKAQCDHFASAVRELR